MQLQEYISGEKILAAVGETRSEQGFRADNLFLFMPRRWPIIASRYLQKDKPAPRASIRMRTHGPPNQPSGGSGRPPEIQASVAAKRPGSVRHTRRRRQPRRRAQLLSYRQIRGRRRPPRNG